VGDDRTRARGRSHLEKNIFADGHDQQVAESPIVSSQKVMTMTLTSSGAASRKANSHPGRLRSKASAAGKDEEGGSCHRPAQLRDRLESGLQRATIEIEPAARKHAKRHRLKRRRQPPMHADKCPQREQRHPRIIHDQRVQWDCLLSRGRVEAETVS